MCRSSLLSSLHRTNGPALSANVWFLLDILVGRWLHSPQLFCTTLFVHLPCCCAVDFRGIPPSCPRCHPGDVTCSHQGAGSLTGRAEDGGSWWSMGIARSSLPLTQSRGNSQPQQPSETTQ